jgi:TolA-binding protein
VGTEFTTSWKERIGQFKINVTRGIVVVTGGSIGSHGVQVRAGSSVTATGSGYDFNKNRENKLSTKNLKDKDDYRDNRTSKNQRVKKIAWDNNFKENKKQKTVVGRSPDVNDVKIEKGGTGRVKKVADVDTNDVDTKFPILCEAAEYGTIMNTLTSLKIKEIERNGNVKALWCLAKAARYTGKAKIAIRLLSATRKRFPDKEQSRLAAFFMGKVIEDLQGNKELAKRWFLQYLKEDPSGPLSGEAARKLR